MFATNSFFHTIEFRLKTVKYLNTIFYNTPVMDIVLPGERATPYLAEI